MFSIVDLIINVKLFSIVDLIINVKLFSIVDLIIFNVFMNSTKDKNDFCDFNKKKQNKMKFIINIYDF